MKKRILAMFCCCVLLLGFVMPPERAHAVALVDDVVVAAAVFVAGCGLTWVVTHTDGEGFTAKVGSLLNDYLSAKFAGQSISDWIGDITFSARAGVLFFPKLAATKFGEFTRWLIDTKGITAGKTTPLDYGSLTTVDGRTYNITVLSGATRWNNNDAYLNPVYGTDVSADVSNSAVSEDTAVVFDFTAFALKMWHSDTKFSNILYKCIDRTASVPAWSDVRRIDRDSWFTGPVYLCVMPDRDANRIVLGFQGELEGQRFVEYHFYDTFPGSAASFVSIGAKAIDIPDTAAIPDDQALGIDTGTNAADMAEIKTLVVDKAVAGELSATVTGATAIPGTVTDVDGLGLPSIATVITQKFPFSIPWDIARGIELLAAPPEAPRWSVDFMAPIAYRVGAWQGDTTVTLDMAEFPLVGQVCRWAFTIGFCLLLAAATKKIAWVA